MKRTPFDADELRRLIVYDPETGLFTWRITRTKAVAGRQAGHLGPDGYALVGVLGGLYAAHRLAWLYMTGEWPPREVDHENRIEHDNRWSNLRLADDYEQAWNMQGHIDRKSRFKGVRQHKSGKWYAQIEARGVKRHLGSFANEEDAAFVYDMWAVLLHGEFRAT